MADRENSDVMLNLGNQSVMASGGASQPSQTSAPTDYLEGLGGLAGGKPTTPARSVLTNPQEGWEPANIFERIDLAVGNMPLSLQLRRQRLQDEKTIRDMQYDEKQEFRRAAAFNEEQLRWPVERNKQFMSDMPMYQATIGQIKDKTERQYAAEQFAMSLPEGPQRNIVRKMAENPYNVLAGSVVLKKMVDADLIAAPSTPEQAEKFLDSDYVKQWGAQAGAELFTTTIGYAIATDGTPEYKVPDFNGMPEDEARKHIKRGMNRMILTRKEDGSYLADSTDGRFLDQYLDSPEGQKRMAARGIKVKDVEFAQAKMAPSIGKEKAAEVQRLEDAISALHDKPETPEITRQISDLSRQRRLLLGTEKAQATAPGTRTANDFVSQKTGGTYNSFEEWSKADPTAAKAGYQEFQVGLATQRAAATKQIGADIKQVEDAQNHLVVLERVKNNADEQFKNVDKMITKESSGLLRGSALYAGAVSGKNPEAATYVSFRDAFASNMARELGGEKGVLTDVDITRWSKILPNLYDSFDTKQYKKKAFYDMMNFVTQQQKRVASGELTAGALRGSKAFQETKEKLLKIAEEGGYGVSGIKEQLRRGK
jgi:hypothetical protein